MGIAFIHSNYADRAALYGGNWQSALPLVNLQNRDIGFVARSVTSSEDDTIIEANLGQAKPVGGFALGPTNMSPGASVVITAYATAAMTGEPLYETTIILPGSKVPSLSLPWRSPGFWLGRTENDEVQERVYIFASFPSDINAAYWRFEIKDANNAAGYVDMGRLLLGRAFRPEHTFASSGNGFSFEPLTDRQESLAGAEYFWRRAHRRLFRCVFPLMQSDELFGQVRRMMSELGIDGEMFVIPDTSDQSYSQRNSFLARFSQIPVIERNYRKYGSTSFDLREVL